MQEAVVDPALLRRALRLVHCLQKERGASCAYYVSSHEPSIVENMEKARIDCDRAIQMMLSSRGELKVHSTLMKIRKMVLAEHGENVERERSRHKILVCFNALISSIVHDYFMDKISKQLRFLHRKGSKDGGEENYDGVALPPKRSCGHHHRARSVGDCHQMPIFSGFTGENSSLNISSAPKDHDIHDRQIPQASPPEALPPMGEPPDMPPPTAFAKNGIASSYGTPARGHRKFGSVDSPHKTHFQMPPSDEDPETQIARLLNLLACFVKLKESTGVERAVLSSLVFSGKEDSLLLSDLVLEVENQRRLLEELKKLPVGSLRSLVEELVEMSQPLHELQQKILKNFKLEGISEGILKHSPDKNLIWDLITVYINKLHALELLIIEEIEYCLPEITNNGHAKQHPTLLESEFITGIFGAYASDDEVRSRLEKMSADEIKAKLLSGLLPNNQNGDISYGSENNHDNSILTVNGEIEDPLLMIPNLPASKEWEINLYELKFLKRIGEGAAGTTYLANWTGQQVAVKVASITETGLDGWRTEVQALQKLHHPNVIRLMGSVYHPNPLTFCLVLEYCSAGDLSEAMKYPTAAGFFFKVAMGVANGVAYLHSRGIMHRDLKPENLLLDGNVKNGSFSVKVSDFGVATDSSVLGDRTAETGTYRWMPPEVIRHEAYSNMADVYSYAIVLWQLITRESPYANLSQIEAAGKVALEQMRPPFPPGAPEAIQSLIRTCWSENPDDRLSFERTIEKLQVVQKELATNEHKWLDAPLGHPVYDPREDGGHYQHHDDYDDDSEEHDHPPPNLALHKKEREKDKKLKNSFFKIFGGGR